MENSLGGQERNDSLQNDNETGRLSSQPPLISFKRDKNIGNFLVRSVLKADDQPGTFKCAQTMQHLSFHSQSGQNNTKRWIKITDRFTCTSATDDDLWPFPTPG